MLTLEQQTFDVLENTNLNWSVKKEPLFTKDGKGTNSFGLYRNDNQKWMGTVGSQYAPYQNHQLVSSVVEIANELGLPIDKGGAYKEGRKVFLQIKLDSSTVGSSNVNRWLTATNSHDGTSSITLGYSNTVVVCDNQFHRIAKNSNRFRHTVSAGSRVKENVDQVKVFLEQEQGLIDNFQLLQSKDMNDESINSTVESLFGFALDAKREDVSTQKMNQVKAFSESLKVEVGTHGKTLWSLFNAVTRYTNHHSAPKDSPDGKKNYLMAGTGYKMNNKAYDNLMSFAL